MTDFVVPEAAPCRFCDGSALAALCGDTADADGPCVMRSGHTGPCWGEGDVAADWSPALPCRTCCVCPCGSTSDGSLCPYCAVQMRPGVNPPEFDPSTHRPRGGIE